MKQSRIILLAACASSGFIATGASAQVALPQVELRGGGASSVAEILPRVMNCVGNPGAGLNQVGTNSGGLSTVAPGLFSPAAPTTANPTYDCATQEIQPDFEGKYISTGSGTGRAMWRTFSTANLNGNANNINPFTGGAGVPSGWANLQFAFSDSAISTSDLSAYNTNAKQTPAGTDPVTGQPLFTTKAGPAIQVPFFVLPVAFAYTSAYGFNANTNAPMNFNVKVPVSINGVVAGGLRMTKDTYCKIYNGEITNWNDPALKTLNSNTSLHDTANDTLARWTSEGAPIRLVGRADGSGTTDIFTRALAAQCGGKVAVNKFTKNAQALPYPGIATGGTPTTAIDIRRMLSSSPYFPTAAATGFAGTSQSLGGLVFDRVSNQICMWDEVNSTTKQCDVTTKGTITNTPTPGLFMVADTSEGVAKAIEGTGSNSLLASSTTGISLNGAFGYIGADWVKPSPSRTLFSAALQKGTSTSYLLPTAANAAAAFGTAILPPQTTATSGAYSITDARVLGAVDPSKPISDPATNNGASVLVDRGNPMHWAAVLYDPNKPAAGSLADPAAGYPVSGATYLLTYTCFKPGNSAVPGNNAKRFGLVELMSLVFGKVTKTSTNAAISANTFKGTGATALGIISQANIATPSAAWINAITETFLKKSTQDGDPSATVAKLGDRNLWIQDGNPTTASDVDNANQTTDQKSNPVCDVNAGA